MYTVYMYSWIRWNNLTRDAGALRWNAKMSYMIHRLISATNDALLLCTMSISSRDACAAESRISSAHSNDNNEKENKNNEHDCKRYILFNMIHAYTGRAME